MAINIEEFVKRRKAKGLSQTDLATLAGVKQQTIAEIEAGRSKTTRAIYRIAEALGCDASVLDPSIPPWNKEFSSAVTDLRKLPAPESEKIIRDLKKQIQKAYERRHKDAAE